ncbi:MAG: CRISPR-associated endoribonuclease Cas6 [Firmicutes bacterium]|nr:CRISPR-associated endoribonuclease Cas6 [Bacillota bacterium]
MQLTIIFQSNGPVCMPVQYNHLVQGMIYQGLENPLLRKFLHEQGFQFEKRRFKLFTFSRLTGQKTLYNRKKRQLVLTPPLHLIICSPIPFILQELGTSFLRRGQARLGRSQLEVSQINIDDPHVNGEEAILHMLSPLTVYSTLPTTEGRNFTHYYSPFEPRFGELVHANLIKKYKLIHGSSPPGKHFSIEPLTVTERDEKVTFYKNFVIKGWMGDYELQGDPGLLQVALNAGLGAKNSQGYGCCTLKGSE